jgi:hypothetical protein
MNTKIKTYKIIVDSKLFTNMRGSNPAEVAKKAASKILGNSLNQTRFSIQAKTGKIRHYDTKWENLVRPYRKNGKLITCRIVVKKTGKQVGGTFPPKLGNLEDPIYMFFPSKKYDIKIIPQESYQKISIFSIFSNSDSNSEWCIDFHIKDRILYLDFLNKCNDNSGSINLTNIIKYAKYLKENNFIDNKIELEDISKINIHNRELSLSLLSILSTGDSWYNKFKFFQKDYKYENEYNKQFLRMNLEDFLNACILKILENKLKYYLEKLNNKIKTFQELPNSQFKQKRLEKLLKEKSERNALSSNGFKEKIRSELISKKDEFIRIFKDKNVQELFTEIKEQLRNPKLSIESLDKIAELFEFIKSSEIIIYDRDLTLTL